ncbi:hypothetical protein M9H77_22447 [Catharanthus roseus]|uniref:Uncharacterized protein n=1 Tax=Catharanthus roseus TaxID=4058 RepID=A0ACC0ARG2_CATRO|nr:hypothetical protein M9H77_22447 [Catharanthus roseus]
MDENGRIASVVLFLVLISLASPSLAYRPGDIVPMSRMGQYHSSRTVWHDMIGRHCPIFAVNREVLVPLPKPTGYTGADPYKISPQMAAPLRIIKLFDLIRMMRYAWSCADVELHPDISKQFWDPEKWPKHDELQQHLESSPTALKEEQSEIDVASGFYVLFGSGKYVFSFIYPKLLWLSTF